MEGLVVQPQAVQRATHGPALLRSEHPPVRVRCFPFLERIDFLPFPGYSANLHHLLNECIADRNSEMMVGGLRGIMCADSDDVIDWPELSFDHSCKNGESLAAMIQPVKMLGCTRQSKNRVQGRQSVEDLSGDLVG